MTPRQTELVRATFRTLHDMREAAAAAFYERLFEMDPGMRHLFSGDMKREGRKLIAALRAAVEQIDRPDHVAREFGALMGEQRVRHFSQQHHETLGAAMLWMLEDRLGNLFTEEVREAWRTAGRAVVAALALATAETTTIADSRRPNEKKPGADRAGLLRL